MFDSFFRCCRTNFRWFPFNCANKSKRCGRWSRERKSGVCNSALDSCSSLIGQLKGKPSKRYEERMEIDGNSNARYLVDQANYDEFMNICLETEKVAWERGWL